MNERIRGLLNEATSGLDPDLSSQRTVTLNEMEKFAELIVKECSSICYGFGESGDGYTCSAEVLEHFGVEE